MDFQLKALPAEPFAPLFALTEEELAARHIVAETVTETPGTPCRVSLADAEIGERVILCNYEHQQGASPYRASHAIYVREGAAQAHLGLNEVPEVIQQRLISLRFFDARHMMVEADVVDGTEVRAALSSGFARSGAAYAHLHYAKPGCFAAAAFPVA
ncbi:MAG: DUF1203 domain-containing protein [Pseudomonadota bacterium]